MKNPLSKYLFFMILISFSSFSHAKEAGIKNATPYEFALISKSVKNDAVCKGDEKCWGSLVANSGEQWIDLKSGNSAYTLTYKVCKETDFSCKTVIGKLTVDIVQHNNEVSIKLRDVEGGAAVINNRQGSKDTYDDSSSTTYSSKIKFVPKSENGILFRGVNLAGAEFGAFLPPHFSSGQIFFKKGANFVRLPVLWEYLFSGNPKGPFIAPLAPIKFNQGYAKQYADVVREFTQNKIYVLIDMHNYMRFGFGMGAGNFHVIGSNAVTVKDYADAWGAIAYEFKDNPYVILDLMNEPFAKDDRDNTLKVPAAELPFTTEKLLILYNEAIKAIRDKGFKGIISLEGMYWSGLAQWGRRDTGQGGKYPQGTTPSAKILIPGKIVNGVCDPKTGICDPLNNYAINVHEYFDHPDGGGGGEGGNCMPRDKLLDIERFDTFMNWVKLHKVKVILSEFGGKNTPECRDAIDEFLTALEANSNTKDNFGNDTGGFIGWTAWSAGDYWGSDYSLLIKENSYQMQGLDKHW